MTKRIIHFAHANGFPAECYRKLFHYLQDEFQFGYINCHGHRSEYPITDNWSELVDELVDYIEKTYHAPVIGLGHSLGGLLTFLAAIRQPSLFSRIVLLDAPVLGPLRSSLIKLAKYFKFIDRVTSGKAAKYRKNGWASSAAVQTYLREKPLFQRFDPDCLQDYIAFGTKQVGQQQIKLVFDPQIEYRIYCTLPDNFAKFKHQLSVPATLIYGNKTHAVTGLDRRAMRKNFNITSVCVDGGHLFPFEQPQLTAEILSKILQQ